jgi:hypothetical protein
LTLKQKLMNPPIPNLETEPHILWILTPATLNMEHVSSKCSETVAYHPVASFPEPSPQQSAIIVRRRRSVEQPDGSTVTRCLCVGKSDVSDYPLLSLHLFWPPLALVICLFIPVLLGRVNWLVSFSPLWFSTTIARSALLPSLAT